MKASRRIPIFPNLFRFREGHIKLSRSDRRSEPRQTFLESIIRPLFGIIVLMALACVTNSTAQEALSDKQRIADLNQLSAMFAKNYAPYEWKRDVVGFDLIRTTPWLQRIHQSNDLDFQETLIEYIASLNDAHSFIIFPSTFSAFLGLSADIYDGRVLVDEIDRTLLPIAQFPFEVGDEIISIDGRSAQDLIVAFRKYTIAANTRSTDRLAADLLTQRHQTLMPHAAEIGDTATLIVRLASTGAQNTYLVPWQKSGLSFNSQGPVPSPRRGNGTRPLPSVGTQGAAFARSWSPDLRHQLSTEVDDSLPGYMAPLRPLLNATVPIEPLGVRNFGSKFPIYALPPGFVQRLGASPSHFFLTGTYVANGLRIGLIRIPNMSPPSASVALQQLNQEIAFMNANTDALVVDVMRNTGGSVSFTESIAQRLIPRPFRTMGFEFRATATQITIFDQTVMNAEQAGAPPEVVDNLRANLNEVIAAFNENRGRTAPISLNQTGSLSLNPVPFAYAKPMLLLTDEFTTSAGEMLAAIFQDNRRGPVFGWRTLGAGGTILRFAATAYTEGLVGLTVSLANRGRIIQTPDYPAAPYIENIGVRPDIVEDFMTRENLMEGGLPFTLAFTTAVVQHATSPQ